MTRLFPFITVLLFFSASAFGQEWERFNAPGGASVIQLEESTSGVYALTSQGIYVRGTSNAQWEEIEVLHEYFKGTHHIALRNAEMLLVKESSVVLFDMDKQSAEVIFQAPFPEVETNPKILAAYISEAGYLVMTNHYLYFSSDGGQTWDVKIEMDQLGVAHINWKGFDYFSASSSALFFVDKYDLHRSFDGGKTWDLAFTAASLIKGLTCIGGYQYFFYNSFPRVIRSTDNFLSWETVDYEDDITHRFSDWFKLVELRDTLFAFSNSYLDFCAHERVFSADKGASWHEYLPHEEFFDDYNPENTDLIVVNDTLLAGSSNGLFALLNNEENPYELQVSFGQGDVSSLTIVNGVLFAQTESGIYSSTDLGKSWEVGFQSIAGYHDPANQFFQQGCSGTWQEMYYSKDSIAIHNYGEFRTHFFDFDSGKWDDTGEPFFWDAYYVNVPKLVDEKYFLYDIETSKLREINLPELENDLDDYFSSVHSGFFVLGSFVGGTLYITDDFGDSWIELNIPNCIFEIYGIVREGEQVKVLYNCFGNDYIFDNTDNSYNEIYPQDWSTGVPFLSAFWIERYGDWEVTRVQDGGLYIAPELDGRFYPLHDKSLFSIVSSTFFDGRYLWVGTKGDGIFRMCIEDDSNPKKSKVELKIFPNPTDGQFTVQSNVLFRQQGTIKIFSAAGRLLQEKRQYPGGFWNVDVSHFPSGIYFLEIKNAEQNEILKFIKQ